MDALCDQGCRPVGHAATVTSSHGGTIFQLDHQSALLVVRRLLAIPCRHKPPVHSGCIRVSLSPPVLMSMLALGVWVLLLHCKLYSRTVIAYLQWICVVTIPRVEVVTCSIPGPHNRSLLCMLRAVTQPADTRTCTE